MLGSFDIKTWNENLKGNGVLLNEEVAVMVIKRNIKQHTLRRIVKTMGLVWTP